MKFVNLKDKFLILVLLSVFSFQSTIYAPPEQGATRETKKKEAPPVPSRKGRTDVSKIKKELETEKKKDISSKEGMLVKLLKKIIVKSLTKLTKKEKSIKFSKIPIWDIIPLPKFIKKYFGTIIIYSPQVKKTKNGFSVSAAFTVRGKKIYFEMKMLKQPEGYAYIVYLTLPPGLGLPDLIPMGKKLGKKIDLLKIKEGAVVFASQDVLDPPDPDWGKLYKGANLRGSVELGGFLAKLDKIFGGIPNKLLPTVKGLISLPAGTGSNFEIEFPSTFTIIPSFLAFGSSKVVIRLLDTGPAISVKGGLIIRIPNRMSLDKKTLLSILNAAIKKGLDAEILNQRTKKQEDFVMFLKAIKADVEQDLTKVLLKKFLLKKKTSAKGKSVKDVRKEIEDKVIKKYIAKVNKSKGKTFKGWIKIPIEFLSVISLLSDRAELFGKIEGKLYNLFGIKGFDAANWQGSLIWDYALSSQLAAATLGIGAIIPGGGSFGGSLEFGKSKIGMNFKGNLSASSGIGDLAWKSDGTIYLRDLVKFWLKGIAKAVKKEKEINKFVNKVVPDWKLEGARLVIVPKETMVGIEKLGKQFELNVDKFELIKNISAGLNIKVDDKILKGSGYVDPIKIKLGKLSVELTKSEVGESSRKGASFGIYAKTGPLDFAARIDGRLKTKLGILGEFVSDSYADVSKGGIDIRSKTNVDLLGLDSAVRISAKLGKKGRLSPKSLFIEGELSSKGLDKLGNFFKEGAKLFLKESQDKLKKARSTAKKNIGKHFRKLQEGTQNRINRLKKEIKEWKAKCKKLRPIKRPKCRRKEVFSRRIAIAALEIHKKVTLEGVKKVGKAGVGVGTKVAQVSAKFIGRINQGLGELSKLFTKLTGKFIKLESVKISAKASDLLKAKLPKISIKGELFGKKFNIKDRQWDLKKPKKVIKNIIKDLKFLKGVPEIEPVAAVG